jgi:hypothetical protein
VRGGRLGGRRGESCGAGVRAARASGNWLGQLSGMHGCGAGRSDCGGRGRYHHGTGSCGNLQCGPDMTGLVRGGRKSAR